MATCLFCGKEFEAERSTAKYCSSKHRTYAGRERRRTASRHEQLAAMFEGNAIIEQLRAIAPNTAVKAQSFMEEYEIACAGAILKLCATFYAEMNSKAMTGLNT